MSGLNRNYMDKVELAEKNVIHRMHEASTEIKDNFLGIEAQYEEVLTQSVSCMRACS